MWPSDAIWWHISGSTVAQVIGRCLMAPSHYLNLCWLIISVAFTCGQSHRKCSRYVFLVCVWKMSNLRLQSYLPGANGLTHWGRATHICVSKLSIIGSDNGLSPGRRQAIIWTNAGILLIRTLGTNFSEILGEIHLFSFSKMHLKMSSAKWHLFGLGLNELKTKVILTKGQWVHEAFGNSK